MNDFLGEQKNGEQQHHLRRREKQLHPQREREKRAPPKRRREDHHFTLLDLTHYELNASANKKC